MANGLAGIPREISFLYRDAQIHPSEAFDLKYSGLDGLISRVNDSRNNRRELPIEIALGEKDLWRERASELSLVATIRYDDATTREYYVRERTNFSALVKKRPSILFLQDVHGGIVVFREARTYPEGFITHVAGRALGPRYDPGSTSQFYGTEDRPAKEPMTNKAMYLPEPYLFGALEALYREQRIPRITPHIYVAAQDRQHLWFVRNFLPLASDVALDANALGAYMGTLQSCGLLEFLDRQIDHYCLTDGFICNYDMDFLLHSTTSRYVVGRDMDDLRDTLTEEADAHRIDVKEVPYLMRRVRRQANEVRARLAGSGMTPGIFIGHLKTYPDTAAIPALELCLSQRKEI